MIDYTKERFEEQLRDMDGAFDLLGGETLLKSFGVVKRGGKVVSIAGMPEPETARKDLDRGMLLRTLFWLASYRIRAVARKHGVSYRYLFMHPDGVELAELGDLIDAGTIRPSSTGCSAQGCGASLCLPGSRPRQGQGGRGDCEPAGVIEICRPGNAEIWASQGQARRAGFAAITCFSLIR